ncbi:hypothetical protein [Streptomyces huasconensis]|uniref:hypothetical protein n=1 Tax=Streptomyces huasconensis TaxID=1854574 RepID=UPI0033F02D3A
MSAYLGEFLLVKALFFLVLMKPTDPARTDKFVKWHYRRRLFEMGLDQYQHGGTVGTSAFPTLAEFAAGSAAADHP